MKAAAGLALIALSIPAGAQPGIESVPFVGCPSDGQTGPIDAPRSGPTPRVAADRPAQLAYYRSEHVGVLAPRGWHCFGLYGSNGSSLVVTPEPHGFDELVSGGSPRGPFVRIGISYGGTSGRFAVAAAISRHFPEHIAFARAVEAEGLMDRLLPSGPALGDSVRRRSATVVETRTTQEGPDSEPVFGLVILEPGDEPTLISVRLRLPGKFASSSAAILDENAARLGAEDR